MAVSPNRQLALDANLLLDLAEGKDFAHEFREEFQSRHYELLLPPTAAAELNALSLYGGEPQRTFASQALRRLRDWKCQFSLLSDTKLAIAERFGRRLLELRLVPEEEWNDGRILGEASLGGIPLLVTSDKHLLDIDEDALLLAFNDADLSPVHPVHPKRLLRALH
ncbi:MAG: hypothetical protein HYY24_23895 [Verrucomicrobia bacterium]|nr:hypothetical protein [Verrucomicrobiota bacterium]